MWLKNILNLNFKNIEKNSLGKSFLKIEHRKNLSLKIEICGSKSWSEESKNLSPGLS